MATANPYYQYYVAQMGSGDYYRSHIAVQRGRGWLGNLFKSAWTFLRPLATTAAKSVGKEMLLTGSNIVHDAITNPDTPLGDIAKTRGQEGFKRLSDRVQSGKGVRKRRAGRQTAARRRGGRTRRRVPAIRDLFSPPSP